MDKLKVEKLKPFEEDKYKNIDLDHLIMYVIGKLNDIGVNLSYENAVVAAFKLFPKKFSLLGYNHYPDSDRVMNCLNRCILNNRRWLDGKVKHGFIITERSKIIIQTAEDMLEGKIIKENKTQSNTRRKEMLLDEIKKSPAFNKYIKGEKEKINKSDICYLLQGTLDSPISLLSNNLSVLKSYATELEQHENIAFLKFIEEKFNNIFPKK